MNEMTFLWKAYFQNDKDNTNVDDKHLLLFNIAVSHVDNKW